MPQICSVLKCGGNSNHKVSVFSFPRDEVLELKWLQAIRREDFRPSKNSRVCELHFEPEQILREASAFDSKTGRTITAPLAVPRLRKGAVPTRFLPSSAASRASSCKNAQVVEMGPPKEIDQTEASQLAKFLENDSATDSAKETENIFFIKSEPLWLQEDLSPFIEVAERSTSTSETSSLSFQTPSCSDKPDSTNVDHNKTAPVPSKSPKKRKLDDSDPCAKDAKQNTTRPEVHRLTKQSVSSRSRKPGSSSRHLKKPRRRSVPMRTNATREMLQSLVNRSSEYGQSHSFRAGDRPRDLFDVFSDFIAVKLREMNWNHCAYALRAILDVVFEVGKIQSGSEDDDPASLDSSSLQE